MQESIFDIIYPQFKINKPIRLITLFSGYDSQALALNYLGVKYEHYKTCEWAIKSIQALKDLHFGNDNRDYSFGIDIEEIKMFLLKKGISQNYNEPMNEQQIKRISEPYARQIYNNIIATHNLVNIQQVKGKDLEVKNTDIYIYICTYSFPCQDLSLAGKGKGFSDTSTRSGMLWEVERILGELKEKPQILLMENVPQVHSQDNIEDFKKWISRLEELGYQNYWQDLIATDYGVPQTRNRCFMISILGNYSYKFPIKQELKTKLKDLLEEKVDERFYLSDKMKKYIFSENDKYKVNVNSLQLNREIACYTSRRIEQNDFIQNNNISPTLTTRGDCVGACVKGIATNESKEWQKKPLEEKSRTILANKSNGGVGCIDTNLRIRKLTPRECFRLMGVKDEDFEKCAKNQSDSSLYHLSGDSIVVNVLMAIFKEML